MSLSICQKHVKTTPKQQIQQSSPLTNDVTNYK